MGSSVVVRIPREVHAKIRLLAEDRHQSVGIVISELVAEHERQAFRERFSASVARTKSDLVGWQEIQAEQQVYDLALQDGLEE